jgi:hypothetical protein
MKKVIAVLGAVFLFGVAGMASAYSVNNTYATDGNGGYTSPYSNVTVETFSGSSPVGTGTAGLYTGDWSGVAAAPYGPSVADTTQYEAVTGTQTINFASTHNYLGLWWGSIDTYNSISFYNGSNLVKTFIGSDIGSDPYGSWTSPSANMYVNFVGMSDFNKIVLTSGSPAFEFDNLAVNNIAPVPEPGTMMLLGMGMLGLAVYGKRRMNKEA